MKKSAWRVLKVENPNNWIAVKAEAERHLTILRVKHKRAEFTGETRVENGSCWGRFLL